MKVTKNTLLPDWALPVCQGCVWVTLWALHKSLDISTAWGGKRSTFYTEAVVAEYFGGGKEGTLRRALVQNALYRLSALVPRLV